MEALRSEENHGRGDLKITGWRMRWLMRGCATTGFMPHADLADLTEFSIICRDLLRTLALADLTDCCRRSARVGA